MDGLVLEGRLKIERSILTGISVHKFENGYLYKLYY